MQEVAMIFLNDIFGAAEHRLAPGGASLYWVILNVILLIELVGATCFICLGCFCTVSIAESLSVTLSVNQA